MNRNSINFIKNNGFFPFPKMIQFEITLRCPFNCSQCYKKMLTKKDIDYSYLTSMIDQAVDNNVSLITLNGGEPLLYPQILELLDYIGKREICTNIFSSGFNLTDDIISILRKYENINFYISLNGSTEEINSMSREGFDISMSAIKKLSNSEVKYGINWVARHDNVKDFINVLELCDKYRAAFISVTSNKITGSGEIQSPLDKNDILLLAEYINRRSSFDTSIFIESCFSMLSTRVNGDKNSFAAHCYAGISNCTINCDGTFQPCTHLKYPEKYESIQTYWRESPILKSLRDNPPYKLAPCRDCEYNKVCSLCRAMHLPAYNDFSVGILKCPNS